MKPLLKYALIILTFSALSATYFYRDFLFINSNSQVKYLQQIEEVKQYNLKYPDYQYDSNQISNYTHSDLEKYFNGWNINDLINYKWWLTFVFTLTFMGITILGIALVADIRLVIISSLFYLGLFGLAFLINLFSYNIARDIIGLLHSPLPFLILVAFNHLNLLIAKNEE